MKTVCAYCSVIIALSDPDTDENNLSNGICPECLKETMEDFEKDIQAMKAA